MITRDLQACLIRCAGKFPAITLTGPRQSGKSTLCRAAFSQLPYVSLEDPDTRQFAIEDPRGFLSRYPDGAVLDEAQRCPELPSYLQGIIDADPRPGRWVLTGSHNFSLLQSVGQSLAGRSAVLRLLPLCRGEAKRFAWSPDSLDGAVFTGGYPRIYDCRLEPAEWFAAYAATYVERDVRSISNIGNLSAFQRFIGLCAGRVGQMLNLSALAGDCGISQPTATAWLSVLEASFICFRLPSYHANIGKRLIKMPKLFFYDSGLACWLLGLRDMGQLWNHPLRGALFENWVASEVMKQRLNAGIDGGLFYYREQNGLEADLLVETPTRIILAEVKSGATPSGEMLKTAVKAAERLRGRSQPDHRTPEPLAVYGGDTPQRRSGGLILPWTEIGGHDWIA